jgi:hypothetical protein
MNPELRARYSRYLRAYPKAWCEANGDALLDTLAESVGADATRLDRREVSSLIMNGWRTRITSTCMSPGAAIREGLVWGVLATQAVGPSFSLVGSLWLFVAAMIVAFPNGLTAVVFGLLAVAVEVYFSFTHFSALEGVPGKMWTDYTRPMSVAGIIVGVAMAIVLFVGARSRGAERRHRSWWWLSLPAFGLLTEAMSSTYIIVVLGSLMLLVVGLAGFARIDPRLPAAGLMPVVFFAVHLTALRTLGDYDDRYMFVAALAAIMFLSWAVLAAMRTQGRRVFRT